MILDCVHFYENRTHSTPNAAELFTIISAWPLPSMHTIKYHLILVSRILLSALSPQISFDNVFQNINLYIILKLRASSNIKMQFYTLDAKNAII
jgi:hypothetical protein